MPHSTATYPVKVDGANIDVAALDTIDLARLSGKEPPEIEKLLKASTTPGFFYLDLQAEASKEALADLNELYGLTEKYFKGPKEEKSQDQGSVYVRCAQLTPVDLTHSTASNQVRMVDFYRSSFGPSRRDFSNES